MKYTKATKRTLWFILDAILPPLTCLLGVVTIATLPLMFTLFILFLKDHTFLKPALEYFFGN